MSLRFGPSLVAEEIAMAADAAFLPWRRGSSKKERRVKTENPGNRPLACLGNSPGSATSNQHENAANRQGGSIIGRLILWLLYVHALLGIAVLINEALWKRRL